MAFIAGIDTAAPAPTDPVSQGDDQIRTLKTDLKDSFPNIDGPVTRTPANMNNATAFDENQNTGNGRVITGSWEWSGQLLMNAGATMFNSAALSGKNTGGSVLAICSITGSDITSFGNFNLPTEIVAQTDIFMRRATTFDQTATFTGTLTANGLVQLNGNTTVDGTLAVNDDVTFGSGIQMRYGNIIAAGATGVSARKVEIFNAAGVSQGFMAIFPL